MGWRQSSPTAASVHLKCRNLSNSWFSMILLTFHLQSFPHSHLTPSDSQPSADSKSSAHTEVKLIQGDRAHLLRWLLWCILTCVYVNYETCLSLSSVVCRGPGSFPRSRRTDVSCSAGINNALDLSAASDQQRSGSTCRWERACQHTSHITV